MVELTVNNISFPTRKHGHAMKSSLGTKVGGCHSNVCIIKRVLFIPAANLIMSLAHYQVETKLAFALLFCCGPGVQWSPQLWLQLQAGSLTSSIHLLFGYPNFLPCSSRGTDAGGWGWIRSWCLYPVHVPEWMSARVSENYAGPGNWGLCELKFQIGLQMISSSAFLLHLFLLPSQSQETN